MNTMIGGISMNCTVLQFQTKLPESARVEANRRIAQSLRRDRSFMNELRRLGIYDEDAADVIDDTEVLEA